MSSLGGLAICGNFFRERGDDDVGVVDAQGCLGEIGDLVGVGDVEALDVVGGLDEDHLVGGFAHGADDLVVAFVADQDDGVAFPGVLDGFEVDLGHERAGGVDGAELAAPGLVADLGRDAVGAVEERGALGDFVERLDEDGAAAPEPLDDELVVDDLVIDVERRAEEIERPLQALDRHVDPRAEAAGIGQDDLHRGEILRIVYREC